MTRRRPMLLTTIIDSAQQVIEAVETTAAMPIDDPRSERAIADLHLLSGLQCAVGDFAHSLQERIAPGHDDGNVPPPVVDLRLVTPSPDGAA